MNQSVPRMSRRRLLGAASASGMVLPGMRTLAAHVPALTGPPRKVTLAWIPKALFHIAVPVAACCVLGIAGSLIRNDKPVAAALPHAVIKAAQWASENPEQSGEIYAPYAPKQRASDLAKIPESVTSDHHPVATNFAQKIAFHVNDPASIR